ncbi:IspD/TarI family cytidylyltransferase [Paenibacillus pinistramenti]|uniref:IspD/TarI family cytidylyltransferase n=1 Tax=Paenibacillus pinistramenti TaxID=1768003 RepID=UPI0011083063|nr:IspD/TarI family cytidylyltransferase [Paenibacillus pinistramenti]
MKKTSMILLAGGQGTRMKQDIPKQFLLLYGRPIIVHVLEKIEHIPEIEEVVISCPEQYIERTLELIEVYGLKKNILCIAGGETRQESTFKALEHVRNESVIIHEAARPFVTVSDFMNIMKDSEENITYALDIPFTVLKGEGYIIENLKRSELINVQLPQKFNVSELKSAHNWAVANNKNSFTEDASLLFEHSGASIKIMKGNDYNLKITTPFDFKIAPTIYQEYFIGE